MLSFFPVWAGGPTYDRLFEGNAEILVEKQIEGFMHVDARGVYSSENALLMVEIENIRFYKLPEYAEMDSDFLSLEKIQCFPEDRFEKGVFIRETSCNNGYGTTICPGTTCVGYFVYTDESGLPTGRTRSSIQKLNLRREKSKITWSEKLDGEELFRVVGIVKEKK
jgi:hypothetical protein